MNASERTLLSSPSSSLLVSDERLLHRYYSTPLELGMPRTGLEHVLTFCFLELSLHKQQKMFTAKSLHCFLLEGSEDQEGCSHFITTHYWGANILQVVTSQIIELNHFLNKKSQNVSSYQLTKWPHKDDLLLS